MRVSTPVADMEINLNRVKVEGRALVLTNDSSDTMPTRAILNPSDVRQVFGAMLRPSVLWFLFTCIFRRDAINPRDIDKSSENHPTPSPW